MRKFFLKVHLYLGLTVGLLFALMGLAGSLLVFSEEIDRVANPHLLTVQPTGERAKFALVEAAVRSRFPNDRIYRIKMPHDGGDVYEFWMNGSEALRVYVDPYTASVLGSRDYPRTFRGRLFMLHTQLLSGETGKTIIGTAAFFFLAIGISGIILWWRGRTKIVRGLKINFRSGWKRTNFDIHNTVGFFAFFFLSISAVSGIYLIFNAPFEKTVNRLTGIPDRPPAPTSKASNNTTSLTLDNIFDRSEQVWPEAETTWLYPPANSNAAYMVRKKFPSENHPNGKSFIYFDQYTGEVLRTENATESPVPTKIVNDLYPLHIGRMGGTATRVLQVFIGLLPTTLLITGFLMWRNKQRKKR